MRKKTELVRELSAKMKGFGDQWYTAYENGDLARCRQLGAERMALMTQISDILHREPSLIERIYGWIFGGQWVREA